MRDLKRHLFLITVAAVLCMGAFVTTSSAQRHRSHISISLSVGSPYRYYPRYYRPYYTPAPVYYTRRVYYRPAPVYYSNYDGYYAPAYSPVYFVRPHRRHRRGTYGYFVRY